ncbi:hypothetical protein NP51_13670, partial [Lacticaseibacillus rhamnosus]
FPFHFTLNGGIGPISIPTTTVVDALNPLLTVTGNLEVGPFTVPDIPIPAINFGLGGEQSGHIVMPALGSTGDGIVTGLRLMTRMVQTGSSLSDLASAMRTLPQVLINVEVVDKATAA